MSTLKEIAAQNGINGGRGANNLWFAPEQITIEPDWNERGGDAYWQSEKGMARVEAIAESILSNGYDQTCPIAVKKKKINGIDAVVLRDGEHRVRAALLAKEKSGRADILVLAVSLPEGMDEFDELALQARANAGTPNTPIETARQVKRLKRMRPDANNSEIAIAINKSRQTVDNALALLELPIALQNMIESDEIRATFAIAFYREHGDQAVALLEEKLAFLQAEGKNKVTAKHFKVDSPATTAETAIDVEVAESAVNSEPPSTEPDAAIVTESPATGSTTQATESTEKKATLKQLIRDVVETCEVGECTVDRKWIGVEVELWNQLLDLAGVKE